MKILPGKSYPLGATFDGAGTNFSIFSETAEKVELCLFDERGQESRIELTEVSSFCWHIYLPNIEPGQRYGYRVYGPCDLNHGFCYNPAKLLLDPYAKAIEGQVNWQEAVFPYRFGAENEMNTIDSAPFVPKSVVINPFFDWGSDKPLARPLNETVIYELHVKGFTALAPNIPENERGKFIGLVHPSSIEYLKKLGVTAVELMPVHQFIHDAYLVAKGLRNYWGYNPIGYFAPHNEYSASGQIGGQVREFKQMVKTLHEAEIEVILDVVYNHTAEGNHLGPMLSFKGIDNVTYYRLQENNQRYYFDYTGTGNTINARHPNVLQLIMDSLRYWILEMHVDGFRFDLATTLARDLHEMNRLSAFFDIIQQDPVISQVKLIAEPWDIGDKGYQVGKFPPYWSEWNGKYRDCVRDFIFGREQIVAQFAHRFTGSSDLYENTGRKPFASINFVTAHDGFTLQDLVSYNQKHNEANGENNKDGSDDNRSWNCGFEGVTSDPTINALRAKQKRNFLTVLFLSQGVPMLLGGDEIGRTQRGNNNCYCQDNELSWYDWKNMDNDLLEFIRNLIKFRLSHAVFKRRGWFYGRNLRGGGIEDIGWFTPDGNEMSDENWNTGFAKSLMVFLNGNLISYLDDNGNKIIDDSFLILFNAHNTEISFVLPEEKWGKKWKKIINTAVTSDFIADQEVNLAKTQITVNGNSIILLMRDKADG
jgi:isoamylase